MHILYLNCDRGIPVLGNKGGSLHVRAVAGLVRLGHRVTLVCSTAGEGNAPPPVRLIDLSPAADADTLTAVARRHQLDPARLGDAPLRREVTLLAHDAALPGRVQAVLADTGAPPDLIYERHALFHLAGATLADALGIPCILKVNAPLAEEQARHRGLVLGDLARRREARAWRAADLLVAVSQVKRARLEDAGPPRGRILVAPNGVDTERFHAAAGAGVEIRARSQLGDDPVLGFVGSFKPWHGLEFLLDVLARVRRARPRLRLLAVGDGPGQPAARAEAAAGPADACVFTGAVPHDAVPARLAAMDFTVAPYATQPGFYFSPLKIVESLAAARPVVALRLGQIGTLIADGATGLLYPPDDAPAWAATVLRLLQEPGLCGRLGAQAALHVRRDWDWTAVVRRTLDALPAQPVAELA